MKRVFYLTCLISLFLFALLPNLPAIAETSNFKVIGYPAPTINLEVGEKILGPTPTIKLEVGEKIPAPTEELTVGEKIKPPPIELKVVKKIPMPSPAITGFP